MTTVNQHTLRGQYEAKKQSAKARMVEFHLTFEEWKVLHKLKSEVTCAYTNRPFDTQKGNAFSVSLERIDDEMGYEVGNVCLVTCAANALKNDYVFLNKPYHKLKGETKANVLRIRRILSTKKNIEKMLKPYTDAFEKLKTTSNNGSLGSQNLEAIKQQKEEKEEMAKNNKKSTASKMLFKLTEKKTKPQIEDVVVDEVEGVVKPAGNPEIALAKQYSEVGAMLEGAGAVFELTFNQFKLAMARKTCAITGRVFEEGDVKSFFLIKKGLPYRKDNVLLTSIKIQKALDIFLLESNIDMFELKKLGDKLGRK
ncbi:MAG: hypothetical protein GY928_05755 [Colwellia sp.]|nr:hypothetical protein [Colwellia sp.]